MYVYGEPAGARSSTAGAATAASSTARSPTPGTSSRCVDNRGTPAPKGRAWRKVVYGAVGVLASKEQAAAVRAAARDSGRTSIPSAWRPGAGAAAAR